MNRKIFRLPLKAIVFFLVVFSFLYPEELETPAEKVRYTAYTQYEELSRFLSTIDQVSPQMNVGIVGRTLRTRRYPDRDFYLCIITEEGAASPEELNRMKPTFLIVSSQHGNEQSAKEAALWLIRDLTTGELKPLLKKINFLIIPQANPYGNFFDQRRNEQDLDLNRDHVKLESPEVETIHRIFRQWMPEITMDVHEKGDDYYRVSIGCVSNVNIHQNLQNFSRNIILKEVEKELQEKKITFHEYLITQPMGIDSSAGVSYRNEDSREREMMKRYSTTDLNDGRNSLGIYETLSFIQEGASRHDIETLAERTRWQYWGIRSFSESIARHADEIRNMVRSFRKDLVEKAKIYTADNLVHLRMEYVRDSTQPTLDIKKFVRSEPPIRGILKNDKKAGEPLTADDIAPYPFPSYSKVEEEVVRNWFSLVKPTLSISRPLGYIIPASHFKVVEILLRHGIQVGVFTKDSRIDVEAYQINEIKPAEYDYLPPEKIEVVNYTMEAIVKKGDYYIPCAQEAANLIPCLLEPQSQYGLIRYWNLQLVPEKGDIFPFYRVTRVQELPWIPFKNWRIRLP